MMDFSITEYDHFSFDLWLTLIKSNPEYKPARNSLFKDFFLIEESLEKVSEVIRYYDVLCNKISENTGRHLKYNEIYLLVLSALKVDIDKISSEKIDAFYDEIAELFEKHPPILMNSNTVNLFEKITSSGKTISIMSNTAFIEGKLLKKVLDFYGLSKFISFQLYSDETGWSKPNPKLFSQMKNEVKKINKNTNPIILHIGDNPKADFQGALNAGIEAYLFKQK